MLETLNPIITDLAVRPVKGMEIVKVDRTTTWATGLAHDSQYIPVVEDDEGALSPLTRRDAPGLARFDIALSNVAVTMSYQGETMDLYHGQQPFGSRSELTLFNKKGMVAEVSDEVSDFVTDYLDIGRRVMIARTVGRREVKQTTRSYEPGASNTMNFQDGYPITIASELSLAALNACVLELGGQPATMDHFRPNITVDTFYGRYNEPEPFAEDYLLRVQTEDDLSMRAVRALARCVIITQNPRTGEKTHGELLKALGKIRSGTDVTTGDRGLFFGMNLVPNYACKWISVGDELRSEMTSDAWIR